jgi:hypothetical protein
MKQALSRRDFLKLGGLAASSMAFNAFPYPQDEYGFLSGDIGRVTHSQSISVYRKPNDQSEILRQLFRDELVNIYQEVTPVSGPEWNPLWYRVWGGYIHSAFVQRARIRHNQPLDKLPESGRQLCEVTVPYTQIYYHTQANGWELKNRLYYETTHWVVGLEEGPDGQAWYRVFDEGMRLEYHVPAAHLRPIPDNELLPISPDVPPHKKRIEVSIAQQNLIAYEEDRPVFETRISSGRLHRYDPPQGTNTPKGRSNVYSKMPSKHMGGLLLTGAPDVYTLPGVPWTIFFGDMGIGVAFHGAYWHNNYGVPMSAGCVNMRPQDAKWLFRWTTPLWPPPEGERKFWEQTGLGTSVLVY